MKKNYIFLILLFFCINSNAQHTIPNIVSKGDCKNKEERCSFYRRIIREAYHNWKLYHQDDLSMIIKISNDERCFFDKSTTLITKEDTTATKDYKTSMAKLYKDPDSVDILDPELFLVVLSHNEVIIFWKKLFKDFPTASYETIYEYSVDFLKFLIKKENDPNIKEQYVNKLMQVADHAIMHIDELKNTTKRKISKGQILGEKAQYYIEYSAQPSVEVAYNMLLQSVELEKSKTNATVLQLFIKYSALKYQNNNNHKKQLIQDYKNANKYTTEAIEKFENAAKNNQRYKSLCRQYEIVKNNIKVYFIKSGATTAEERSSLGL